LNTPANDIRKESIILENDKVLLRPLEISDIEYLLPFALNEPDLWNYSIFSPAGSAASLEKYIADTLEQKFNGKEYPFMVYDKRSNSYAGSTRFYDIQIENNSAQLGYTWYGKAFQRTGLNRNCKLLLLEFAFETWKLERVEFRSDIQNERSVKAMHDIGCKTEGVLRSCVYLPLQNRRRDSIVLSILKDEWFNSVKQNLQAKTY
jgi:RimJ/RimL family protein N-acetyltransferase